MRLNVSKLTKDEKDYLKYWKKTSIWLGVLAILFTINIAYWIIQIENQDTKAQTIANSLGIILAFILAYSLFHLEDIRKAIFEK